MKRALIIQGDTTQPHLVVAFARRHTPASFVIRSTRPGARYSHTALLDPTRDVFIEALMFKGVVETPTTEWLQRKRYSALEFVAVSCPRPQDGLEWARSTVGAGYDYWGATSVPWRTSWQDEHRWYCIEHSVMALTKAGKPVFRDAHRGIHPHDGWRVLLPAEWQPRPVLPGVAA